MSAGTFWLLCSSSAPSLNSPKQNPPPPQGNRPRFRQTTGRPDHASGLPSILPATTSFDITVSQEFQRATCNVALCSVCEPCSNVPGVVPSFLRILQKGLGCLSLVCMLYALDL